MRFPRELQLAGELPPGVAPEFAAVAEIVVADGKPLRVVAQLVLPQQAERPRESDLHAQVDQRVFEPARTLEAVVDELAMAAERVTEQQHGRSGADVERERAGPERQRAADDGGRRHAEKPQ